VAALFYASIESAELSDADPCAYLREATRRAIRGPRTAPQLAADLEPAGSREGFTIDIFTAKA
jgi:hypothetical protein